MTILHDNLYTKRAVSVLRGRNRYLSRAVWTVRVNEWRNRKLLQNGPVMKPNKPSSMTCSAERLVASNNFRPPRQHQKRPLPSPNPPRGHPVAPHRGLQVAPHRALPQVPHRSLQVGLLPAHLLAPHWALPVALPPVHLLGLLRTLPWKHTSRRQQNRRQPQQQTPRRWNPKLRLKRSNPSPPRNSKPPLNRRLTLWITRLPPIRF